MALTVSRREKDFWYKFINPEGKIAYPVGIERRRRSNLFLRMYGTVVISSLDIPKGYQYFRYP